MRALQRQLRTPLGIVTAVMVGILVLLAVLGPILWTTWSEETDFSALQGGMSAAHWFGTDGLGRDIMARTLVATRLSLELAVVTTAFGVIAGVTLGSLPLVLGRRAGRFVAEVINLGVAFPGLLLALFFSMIFGVGAWGAVLALMVAWTPTFARLTYTTAGRVAGADFVSAARMLGQRRHRLILRHILPNIAEPLLVNATFAVGLNLLNFAALSFLGFGVQPPSFDWGRLLNEGLKRIYVNPGAALFPGVAIAFAGIAFALAGEVASQLAAGAPGRTRRRTRAVDANDEQPDAVDAAAGVAPVLRVRNLTVTFPAADGPVRPVRGVTFDLRPGEIVGMVGESGSGKSMTASAVGCLVPYPGSVTADSLELAGSDVLAAPDKVRHRVLGSSLATVFQDPMSALNPAIRVGRQLAEVSEVHQHLDRREAMVRAVQRLAMVRIPSARRRARQYPDEFSGGMRQRAVIGMGLMAEPSVIIADEPTTALDVTVQREVLALLRRVRDERQVAVLLISHDIGVIATLASRVLVMYAGRIVEDLPVAGLRQRARHPYTRALLASVPDMQTDRDAPLATIAGRPPEPGDIGAGCSFAPRCPFADEQCGTRPPLVADATGSRLACWHPQTGPVSADSAGAVVDESLREVQA